MIDPRIQNPFFSSRIKKQNFIEETPPKKSTKSFDLNINDYRTSLNQVQSLESQIMQEFKSIIDRKNSQNPVYTTNTPLISDAFSSRIRDWLNIYSVFIGVYIANKLPCPDVEDKLMEEFNSKAVKWLRKMGYTGNIRDELYQIKKSAADEYLAQLKSLSQLNAALCFEFKKGELSEHQFIGSFKGALDIMAATYPSKSFPVLNSYFCDLQGVIEKTSPTLAQKIKLEIDQ